MCGRAGRSRRRCGGHGEGGGERLHIVDLNFYRVSIVNCLLKPITAVRTALAD
jgi:hypothetical protein